MPSSVFPGPRGGGTISTVPVPLRGGPEMNARIRHALVSEAGIVGVVACILFWGISAFAQKTPQHVLHLRGGGAGPAPGSRKMLQRVDPPPYTGPSVDKNTLSEEESREYASLVDELQRKLDEAAQEFQRRVQS